MSGGDTFSDVTLHTDDFTRDEQRAIVLLVTAALPNRADYMPVLQALLAPMNPAIPPHGTGRTAEYAEARTAWLERCRQWIVAQGRIPNGRQISSGDQLAYVRATGDRFVPPVVAS